MATTAADLVREAQRDLLSGVREGKNKLASGVSAGAATLTFTYAITGQQSATSTVQAITPGDVLSIDLERFYVWAATPTGQSVTVEPGWDGTTPAAHATGAVVTRNARFDDYAVLAKLNEELDALSAPNNGLFQVKTATDITYNPAIAGYDLAGVTNLIDILEIRYKIAGPSKDYPLITNYSVAYNQATAEFASGTGLILYQSAFPGQPIHVVYAAPFAHLVTLADNVQTVAGLSSYANDIPPMGAFEALIGVREARRNFTEGQSESRRASEVPPGAVRQSAASVSARRLRRIGEEAARLRAQFPLRSKAVR